MNEKQNRRGNGSDRQAQQRVMFSDSTNTQEKKHGDLPPRALQSG